MKKYLLIVTAFLFSFQIKAQGIVYDQLDINNVKAQVNASGDLFWDFAHPKFEVPKGSGLGTIFADNLWIGGLDAGGNLKIAAGTYRQSGTDFWPGPLDSIGNTNSTVISDYNRVWKLKKCDIEAYQNWMLSGQPNPMPIDSIKEFTILNWPTVSPYGYPLAPYFDYNGDNMYDANWGDIPLIKGDQAIFFVYNDKGGPHTETGGNAIGVEIQTMVYEYDCPDSSLQNTIFVDYKIINRSSFALNNAFIGKWTDFDIGGWADDYVGCDVARGAYFGYNGDSTDDFGYGIHPAAQGVVFLKGAFADANGMDDPASSAVNGNGYGDGITDNEDLGMTRFMYYMNTSNPVNGNPNLPQHYYNYLSGSWLNGTPWTYGGNGIGTGTTCTFMLPGTSDPAGFGTSGIPQMPWDENSAGILPGDRRGLAATGPFTFLPGASQTLEVAYVFGRDYSALGGEAGVAVMKQRIDSVRFKNIYPFTGCCSSSSTGIRSELTTDSELKLYPNPASSLLFIEYSSDSNNNIIEIYDVRGQLVKKIENNSSIKQSTNISDLSKGLYFVKISDREKILIRKFVKE
jgi:hypothetical protein